MTRAIVQDRAVPVTDRLAAAQAGSDVVRLPYRIGIRELEVLRTERLSPTLVRVTLGGPGIVGFQSHVPEEHVRLIFPDEHGELRLPEPNGDMLRWPRPMPVSREYTVRRFDPATGELDIDFALHPGGVASNWAESVQPGARVPVAGPPGGHVVPSRHDRFLFAGDLTALPQIARYLERLPRTATGWAIVEVGDACEEIALDAPSGVQVRWVHRGDLPPGSGDALERAVRAVELPEDGRTLVWIAGEADAIRPLRRWVKDLGLPAGDVHITGYWKRSEADYDDD